MKSDIIDNRNKSTMIRQLITEFPLSDVPKERTVTEEKIRKYTYTKEEIDVLIANAVKEAVEEAVKIDEASMAKHNRDATVISMILGFTTLALFVDGLLRMLGIIPPFMDLDVNILDKIETDIIDKVKQVPIQKVWPFR
jgi:AAA15 family ATPase/GTPase